MDSGRGQVDNLDIRTGLHGIPHYSQYTRPLYSWLQSQRTLLLQKS